MSNTLVMQHSFIILAYKESVFLEDCIRSTLHQTLRSKVEIATSTPNEHISKLAEKYGLPLHTNTNGGSIGKDWNFALAKASTPFVTLAHQDDIYHSDFALSCVTSAEKNKESDPLIVFTASLTERNGAINTMDYKNILRWLLVLPFHFKNCISSPFIKRFILLFSNSISCPGVMYVKKNLAAFSFAENQQFTLDWHAWYAMSKMNGSFIYAPKKLHTHREHNESATSNTITSTLQREEFELLREMWGSRIIASIITAILRITK